MDKKNRWLKYTESIKEDPIKLFEKETLSVGWAFFWRQLILLGPVYLFVWYLEFKSLFNNIILLIIIILLPYIFYSLGIAEDWRKKSTLLLIQDFISTAKKGVSLWWRILIGWIRFVPIIFVLAFILYILNTDDQFINIIALLIWFIGSIPVMGLAVRHWNRLIEVDQSEIEPEAKSITHLIGRKLNYNYILTGLLILAVAYIIFDKVYIDRHAVKIEKSPEDALYYANQGFGYLIKGQYDNAISDFNKAEEINPDDTFTYKRALIYAKGQYDNTISMLTEGIERNPEDASAYINRGSVYAAKGRYDSAISDFTEAIKRNPEDASVYYIRGLVYVKRDRFDSRNNDYYNAIHDFTKAIEINPKHALSYYDRGLIYYRMAHYDSAISDFNKALELNPEDASAYINRGIAYAAKSQYDKTISDFNKAMNINPENASAYINRGVSYAATKGT